MLSRRRATLREDPRTVANRLRDAARRVNARTRWARYWRNPGLQRFSLRAACRVNARARLLSRRRTAGRVNARTWNLRGRRTAGCVDARTRMLSRWRAAGGVNA